VKWAKVSKNPPLMMSLTKNLQPSTKKIFFIHCQLQDLPSLLSLWNSSLPHSSPELCSRKTTCDLVILARNPWKKQAGSRSV